MSKPFPLLVIPGLALTSYWTICHGAPGLVAGILITLFLVMGISGIMMGGAAAGIGAVFIWFVGFVVFEIALFLGERCFVDTVPGKVYGPGGDYFADKVLDIISGGLDSSWGFINTSHPYSPMSFVFVGLGILVICSIAGLLVRK